MIMIDHNEILFRSKNGNFLYGRQVLTCRLHVWGQQVFTRRAFCFIRRTCFKGQDKFDNGNGHEHIWRIIGGLFRQLFSTKMLKKQTVERARVQLSKFAMAANGSELFFQFPELLTELTTISSRCSMLTHFPGDCVD